ncbi:MAG TPA: hypothetical protein VE869_02690 [Gemmatimonas sp.]|nr:hypothetical protein [Gemmatimonas sp.]
MMVVLVGMLSASAAPLQSQVAFDREVIELVPGGMSRAYSEFTVRNTGAGEMEATVRLEDWDVDAGGRSHWRASGRVAGSCKGRVTVSPENIRLGPGEQRTLRITVREGARFDAECWTAAVVQPTRFAARPFSVEPTVMTRGSLPLYVTPPELDVAGAVSALIVRRDSIDVLFENTGRSRADIVGVVQVRTHDNTVVHSMPLPEATVLPGGLRRYRIPVPALPPGRFTVIGIVDFGGDVMAAAQAALEITRTNTQSTTRTGTR